MNKNWRNSTLFAQKIKASLVVYFCLAAFNAYSIDVAVQDIEFGKGFKQPWFTGSLLSPSGYVVMPGHFNVEPYFYYTYISHRYNENWSPEKIKNLDISTLIIPFRTGLGKGWDFGITPGAIGKYSQHQTSYGLSDWVFGFNYQILDAELNDPYPAIKLIFKGVIPLGKYQHLNPSKKRTDIRGEGSWWPTVGIGFTKMFQLSATHFLELRGGVLYFIATPVWVNGYNTYGGAANTHAKVYNGNVLTVSMAAQYNIDQNWALSLDLFYKHKNANRYKGFAGSSGGSILSLAAPSNENYSIAPAIQYNFTQDIGITGGFWFSVAGRNSTQFRSGVIALNIYR